jgi:hypothetical protein
MKELRVRDELHLEVAAPDVVLTAFKVVQQAQHVETGTLGIACIPQRVFVKPTAYLRSLLSRQSL